MDNETDELVEQVAKLPKDVGWTLLITGIATEVGVPGIPPFWIAGVLILWPKTGQVLTGPLQRRFPKLFKQTAAMVARYATDLEARYPSNSSAKQCNTRRTIARKSQTG
jgi:hypothetical protein